ncbi:MAG: hypothetical protein HY820_31680 [Acidobacteria bacterium]|nr:hypothetical protein [Acidobacteriota bacterium]
MQIRRLFFAAAFSALSLFAADAGLLRTLPADSAFIAGIRADQVRSSRFGQFLLDQMKTEEKNMNEFITATGFDPRRDLSELVVASSNAKGHGKTLVVARGRFDVARIQEFTAKHGMRTQLHQGVNLMAGNGGHSEGALAVLDGSTAVAGDLEMVKAAIDRHKSSMAGVMDPKVANRIMDMSTKYDAWMVSASLARLADDVKDPQLGGMMAGDFMKSMESVLGGVRFGTNIEIMTEATMRSEKDATAMVDVVKFLAGMLQLNSQNDKRAGEAARLLDKMELKASGTQFRMSLTIPEEMVEGFLKPAAVVVRKKNPVI